MSEKILAKVNGREIRQSDLDAFKSTLTPDVLRQFQGDEGESRLVGELINQQLFYLESVEDKVEETEEFKLELEAVKENLLKQFGIKRLLENITVSEEEISDFYSKNTDMFVEPAKVKASHILVATEEEINDVANKIKAGETFENLAKEVSTCPSGNQGGDLGFFGKGQMVPEFEEVAFATEIGKVSEPVKTQFGYHLIKVVDKEEPMTHSLDAVRENIRQNLLIRKQNNAYLDKVGELAKKYPVERF